MLVFGCFGQSRPAQDADVVARALAVVALAALAVIHTVDLPGTLGPAPLVGIGYFGIIIVAMLAAAVMVVCSHWLAWAAAGGLAVAAMGGYVLTRSLPGGFLDDHGDVGNWHCPLGVAALSVEALIIVLVAGWGAWHAQVRAANRPRRPGALRAIPARADGTADSDRPLRPVP